MNRKTLKILYNLFPRNKVKTISVTDEKSEGNLVVGGFYTLAIKLKTIWIMMVEYIQALYNIIVQNFQRMDSNG
jgi:hypothetical protein